MIISLRSRFAFFRVPRTGSTTAELLLRLSGAFNESDMMTAFGQFGLPSRNLDTDSVRSFRQRIFESVSDQRRGVVEQARLGHMTLSEAVECGLIQTGELESMNCYAFVRNPVDRYLSAFQYFVLRGPFEQLPRSEDSMAKAIWAYLDESDDRPRRLQVEYFFHDGKQFVKPLLFSRFQEEIVRLVRQIGGFVCTDLPNFNLSPHAKWSKPIITRVARDRALRDAIRTRFRDDFEFYENVAARPEPVPCI